ncbi:hypothetical protein [Streptomyces sp. DSM 41534]
MALPASTATTFSASREADNDVERCLLARQIPNQTAVGDLIGMGQPAILRSIVPSFQFCNTNYRGRTPPTRTTARTNSTASAGPGRSRYHEKRYGRSSGAYPGLHVSGGHAPHDDKRTEIDRCVEQRHCFRVLRSVGEHAARRDSGPQLSQQGSADCVAGICMGMGLHGHSGVSLTGAAVDGDGMEPETGAVNEVR